MDIFYFLKDFIHDISNPLSFVINYLTKVNEYRCEIIRLENERVRIELYYKYNSARLIYAFDLVSSQLHMQSDLIEKSFESNKSLTAQINRIIDLIDDINNKLPNCSDSSYRTELITFGNTLVLSLDKFNEALIKSSENISTSLKQIDFTDNTNIKFIDYNN